MSKCMGMDIGDCNSTQTFSRVVPSRDDSEKYEILNISPFNASHVVLTKIHLTDEQMMAIARYRSEHEENNRNEPDEKYIFPQHDFLASLGEMKIGEQLSEDKDGEVFSYFKVSPSAFREECGKSKVGKEAKITHEEVMACFIHALLMKTVENSSDISHSDLEHLTLYIGCPATGAWTDSKPRKRYENLVKQATGVKEVVVVPESRAALFSNINKRRFKALSAQNGVLVFDFGSSTADCTYMKQGVGKLELSWTLGAGHVENNMMKKVRSCVAANGYVPNELSCLKIKNECREFKEKYFLGNLNADKRLATFVSSEGETKTTEFSVDKAFIDDVTQNMVIEIRDEDGQLHDGSWAELCREFFEHARRMLVKKQYGVSSVVLTGGASRMPFIEPLCRAVFGETVEIVVESEPEFTVSNGLGWVSVVDGRVETCVEDALKKLHAIPDISANALKYAVTPKIQTSFLQCATQAVDEWAQTDDDEQTLNDLKKRIDDGFAKNKQTLQAEINTVIQEWKTKLNDGIVHAVNGQADKLFSSQAKENLILQKDIWKELNADGIIKLPDAVGLFDCVDLSSSLRRFGKVILVMVYTGIFSVFGPGGALIGFAAGMLSACGLDDKDMDKPRKRQTRKKAAGQLKKMLKKKKYQKEIRAEIERNFEAFENGYADMVKLNVCGVMDVMTLRRFDVIRLDAPAAKEGNP